MVGTLAAKLVGGAQETQTDRSPAARVLGEGNVGSAVVTFDAQNTPWVTWSVDPEEGVASSGLFVARLVGHYRLASIHRGPGPHLERSYRSRRSPSTPPALACSHGDTSRTTASRAATVPRRPLGP
jgi:hypothetical protein